MFIYLLIIVNNILSYKYYRDRNDTLMRNKKKQIRDRFSLSKVEEAMFEGIDKLTQSLSEANIMRLDSATARKRRLRHATLMAAKEAQDPLYFRYAKLSKARRATREKIQVKYESKGKLKLAEYEARKREQGR